MLSSSVVSNSFDRMDCSLPGSSVHGDSPGKNTGVVYHALLQGIFPTQGSNLGLLHCRQILYHLSHQGSPRILEWVSLLQGICPTQESNWGLLHCSRFFTSWTTREAHPKPYLTPSYTCFPLRQNCRELHCFSRAGLVAWCEYPSGKVIWKPWISIR